MKDLHGHPSRLFLGHDVIGHVLGFIQFKAAASVGHLSFNTGVVQRSCSTSSLVCFCYPSPPVSLVADVILMAVSLTNLRVAQVRDRALGEV